MHDITLLRRADSRAIDALRALMPLVFMPHRSCFLFAPCYFSPPAMPAAAADDDAAALPRHDAYAATLFSPAMPMLMPRR